MSDDLLSEWEAQADLLEPHHEYKEAEPSRSGKTGVRCVLCGHYTNGMERGNCSPCPEHASYRIKSLINAYRKQREVIEKKDLVLSRYANTKLYIDDNMELHAASVVSGFKFANGIKMVGEEVHVGQDAEQALELTKELDDLMEEK